MKQPISPRQKRAWRSALAGLGLLTLSPAPAALAARGPLARQEPAVVPCALTVRQQPLAEVLASIEQQTGYRFLYVDQANRLARRITVEAPHSNLKAVLALVAAQAGVAFTVQDKRIVVKATERGTAAASAADPVLVQGRVTDATGAGLPGVSIRVKDATTGTTSTNDGSYQLSVPMGSVLTFSFIGYLPQQLTVGEKTTYDLV
ncbi:MAG: hypothetical protein EOO59_14440, partial [Hymenobacter sp.]